MRREAGGYRPFRKEDGLRNISPQVRSTIARDVLGTSNRRRGQSARVRRDASGTGNVDHEDVRSAHRDGSTGIPYEEDDCEMVEVEGNQRAREDDDDDDDDDDNNNNNNKGDDIPLHVHQYPCYRCRKRSLSNLNLSTFPAAAAAQAARDGPLGDAWLDSCTCSRNCKCRKGDHRLPYRMRVNGEKVEGVLRIADFDNPNTRSCDADGEKEIRRKRKEGKEGRATIRAREEREDRRHRELLRGLSGIAKGVGGLGRKVEELIDGSGDDTRSEIASRKPVEVGYLDEEGERLHGCMFAHDNLNSVSSECDRIMPTWTLDGNISKDKVKETGSRLQGTRNRGFQGDDVDTDMYRRGSQGYAGPSREGRGRFTPMIQKNNKMIDKRYGGLAADEPCGNDFGLDVNGPDGRSFPSRKPHPNSESASTRGRTRRRERATAGPKNRPGEQLGEGESSEPS
jgi:hypothetical protein